MSERWQEELGWSPELARAMAPHGARGLQPGRVSLVYRRQLRIWTARGELWAQVGGRVMHNAKHAGELPVIGDWVAARLPPGEGEALVNVVLPRKTAFVRKVAGQRVTPQVLAANIDSVLVVMGLDNDFNLRRAERYLTLAWESGAQPVVVLNKRDQCPHPDARLAQVRAVAREAPCHAVSALTGEGLGPLGEYFAAGKTVALLGSSGVGKSTLVNNVVGAQLMTTQEVRTDGKGRHTTTHRELLKIPGGGSVIDSPGLREIQMWDAGGGLARTFDDIEDLAAGCKFGDCQHETEPACAVQGALAEGLISASRLENWRALQRELAWLERPSAQRPEGKRRARLGHGVRRK